MVVNRHMVLPTSAFTQKSPLPTEDEVVAQLARFDPCLIDADRIATEAGSSLAQNVVILGAASWSIPLNAESLLGAVKKLVPPKTVEANVKAFEMGRIFGRT
jgi:indolepyruvate ferredoxin oxidoreductase beta subunit